MSVVVNSGRAAGITTRDTVPRSDEVRTMANVLGSCPARVERAEAERAGRCGGHRATQLPGTGAGKSAHKGIPHSAMPDPRSAPFDDHSSPFPAFPVGCPLQEL